MSTKLFVGNLSFKTTEPQLAEHFSQCGEVRSAKIPMDRETGRPRGFGFVEYASDDDAQAAIRELNGKDLDGRDLRVNEARPQEPRGRY